MASGADLTVRLTPWWAGYSPLALETNGEFATSEDTYTFENIQDDIDLKVYFYNPKVPPAAWAKEAVGKARVLGIDTEQIEDFSLPITRKQFFVYAFTVYHKLTGDWVDESYNLENPYTDATHSDVLQLSKLGVITGVGDGRFDPDGQLTPEQAAGIMGGAGNGQFDPQGTYSCEQSIVTLMRPCDMVK